MSRMRKSFTGLAMFGVAAGAAFMAMTLVQNVQFATAQQEVEATRQQLSQVEDLAHVFREVGKVIEPSVVSIRVTKRVSGAVHNLPFDEETLRRFFPDRNNDGQPDVPRGMPEGPFEQQGNGSGVIMEADNGTGFVLTNNHVVSEATEMTVVLADGRTTSEVTVVGTDRKTDVAVLKIEQDRLVAAKWGDSDTLQKGDWILAFGSPFGYVGSMSHGIVSALNRTDVGILGDFSYENFIQVDAPINPGNSGGPLVNIRGEVVGINTAIASRTGTSMGVGFAIPANQAQEIYGVIRKNGKVVRGFLGVAIDDAAQPRNPQSRVLLKQLDLLGKPGVFVLEVTAGTPAYGALEPGDVITEYNGKPVQTVQELRGSVALTAPGTAVPVKVIRNGEATTVSVTIGEQPESLARTVPDRDGERGFGRGSATTNVAKLGMRLATLDEELARRFELEGAAEGVVLMAVAPRSPAARAGLEPGMVITRVGSKDVATAEDAAAALEEADVATGVILRVRTPMGSRVVPLTLEP